MDRPTDGATDAGAGKPAARRRARAERRPVDPADHVVRLEALARFLELEVGEGCRVVVYDALADEVDLSPLLAAHPRPGRRFALTRTPDEGHRLTVHPLGGPTERHRHGYDQPRSDGPTVDDAEVGAVVVPGLAFDRRGHRLGRGGGFYDRFLARLGSGVLRIGICPAPPLGELPVEAHDVAMTHLALAEGVIAVEG